MFNLTDSFRTIGARIKVHEGRGPYALDVGHDRAGEYFELLAGRDRPAFHVLQVVPNERHLLMFASDGQRFLCGHDERHLFVAGIRDRVSTVRQARESLLPEALRGAVGAPDLLRRRNKAFVRQGEWFFVPATPPADMNAGVYRNERLFRARFSKPHVCQFLVRRGGELVHFARRGSQVRNPQMFVRGYVRHADHATIMLDGWHRVYLNSEFTTGNVTFYD